MSTTHTPGPWHIQQVGTPGYFVINQAHGIPVPATGPKGEANARLMAAAPELAAALARAFEFLDTNFDEADMADILVPCREALRRAGALPPTVGNATHTREPTDEERYYDGTQWTAEQIAQLGAKGSVDEALRTSDGRAALFNTIVGTMDFGKPRS